MRYVVDTEIWLPVALVNAADRLTPEGSVLAAEIRFFYGMLDGTTTWQELPLDGAAGPGQNFIEKAGAIDTGDYNIRLTAAQNDTTGVLGYSVIDNDGSTLLYKGNVDIEAADVGAGVAAIQATLGTPAGASMSADIAAIAALADTASKVLSNRWKIDTASNRFIIYDTNGTTALLTFDLFDQNGLPTFTAPFERRPV